MLSIFMLSYNGGGALSISLLFWILMILWLVFGFIATPFTTGQPFPWKPIGGHLLIWILLALLGWRVFGPAISG